MCNAERTIEESEYVISIEIHTHVKEEIYPENRPGL